MAHEEEKRVAMQLRSADKAWGIDNALILSQGYGRGPFDESHGGQTIFWRGDSRSPKEVFKTGFSAKAYRQDPEADYAGNILWRCSDDDIYHDSGVSLARDIRGAAFFPFTDDDTEDDDPFSFYLYAVAPTITANTFRAQQIADAVETGEMRGSFAPKSEVWRNHDDRLGYDPGEEEHGDVSCVWQFQEQVALTVPREQIVGGWSAYRRMLVRKGTDSRERAGIRFWLETRGAARGPMDDEDLFRKANAIVAEYARQYPKMPRDWLSFQGIVECESDMPNFAGATRSATQLQAIVVESKKLNDRGEW